MQFRDLKKQYEVLKEDIDKEINEVILSAGFISGKKVKELEEKLANYVGVKHCITCANGTDALTLALKAWGVKEGDAVFVPDFTFFSSGECPAAEGATPIFVDVCEDTFNLDPVKLEEAIIKVKNGGKYTPKVVVAVDLFG
ncbi:MAG: DegT/DnrJ/EryC1/StrS family aminotransferase, partial [Clostridia bacterium]|nr:DegT/DnrJ/EryC1/StrS family aminotransferase [Clostridia bacterium]